MSSSTAFVKFVALLLVAALAIAGASSAQSDSISSDGQSHPIKVAVTVDDLPEHGDLPPGVSREDVSRGILKAFKENGVDHAYGFTNGYFMDRSPEEIEILKEWLIAGYPLGNHTYSHSELDSVTTDSYIADIEKQDRLLQTLATFSPLIQKRRMFRYPFLEEGSTLEKRNAVRAYLAGNGYRIAEVTIDYYDWAWADAYTRCLGKHDDKSIQWLKDHVAKSADRFLHASSSNAKLLFNRDIPQILLVHITLFNALTLDKILKGWRAQGVQFVSLDGALSDPVYALNPNLTSEGGRSFLEQFAEARKIAITPEDPSYSFESLNKMCM